MKIKAIPLEDLNPRRTYQRSEKGLIYLSNGKDNAYPTRIEYLINNSITAKSCVGVIADYIQGKGFIFETQERENAQNAPFNPKKMAVNSKGDTPNVLLEKVALSLAYHRGVFLHVNYNLAGEKTSVQVLPYKYCRLGSRDDDGYRGKILYFENWDKEQTFSGDFKNKVKVLDAYDPRAETIEAQIRKAGGIEKWNGQVFFLNLDRNDYYPLSYADACQRDCESEYRSSIYTLNGFKKGFFGTYLMVTAPMENKQEKQEFQEVLKQAMGVHSENTILHFTVELKGDKVENEVLLKPIESNIRADLFSYADKKTMSNIRKAMGNVPLVLIDSEEGKMGQISGEGLSQARSFMSAQTHRERQVVEETFEELFSNFHKEIAPNGIFKIQPI